MVTAWDTWGFLDSSCPSPQGTLGCPKHGSHQQQHPLQRVVMESVAQILGCWMQSRAQAGASCLWVTAFP